MQNEMDMIAGLVLLAIVCFVLYFLPTIISLVRGHSYKWVIFALNLAAGWTAVGWLVAMVWSVWPSDKTLIDPVVGNVSGRGVRNAGDTLGAARHGLQRGQAEEARRDARLSGSSVSTIPVDHIGQLERLAALRSSGLLTDDEVQAQKMRLFKSYSAAD